MAGGVGCGAAMPPKIFISYRREDSQATADHLYDRLEGHFGSGNVFFDVDSIPIGRDFVEYLDEQVSQCDVLLALVGKKWLGVQKIECFGCGSFYLPGNLNAAKFADNSSYLSCPECSYIIVRGSEFSFEGLQGLHDENDFVRIEIISALNRDITVVPVLVEGAKMPAIEMLPPELEKFSRRQAAYVRPGRDFRRDVNDLIKALESMGLVAEPKSEITKRNLSKQPKEGALTCPHCQQTFEVIEICYVAKHPALLGDPLLGADHSLRFVPADWKDGKPVDSMGEVCDERACVHCHVVLPRSMQRSIENTD